MNNKYGLIVEEQKKEDYLFGSYNGFTKKELSEDGNFTQDLPTGVTQSYKYFDSFDCVSRAALATIAIILNAQIRLGMIDAINVRWLRDNGYFDENGKIAFDIHFIAQLAKTVCRVGNGLTIVADVVRKYGLIPRKEKRDYKTCEEYYSEVIPKYDLDLGIEFLTKFQLNYETVRMRNGEKIIEDALKYSPLQIIVRAWYSNNGVYENEVNEFNHSVVMHRKKNVYNYIFDSYTEMDDTPYVKKLSANYLFGSWGYAWFVTELPIKHKDMIRFVKSKESTAVYMIDLDKRKHLFTQAEAFQRYISNDWGQIETIPQEEIDRYIVGLPFDIRQNTLFNFIKSLFSN